VDLPLQTSLALKSRVTLLVWAVGVVVLGSLLTAVHALPLRVSRPNVVAKGTGQWTTVHALATKCGCSKRLFQHLVARRAMPGVAERVLLVDATREWTVALEQAGFEVIALDAPTLRAEYGVEAAPLFGVRTPTGEVAYWGAYAAQRSAPPQDVELFERARAGARPDALPLFGCAVSRELQQRSDPLKLKYGAWK
jgi:hypothetical protein